VTFIWQAAAVAQLAAETLLGSITGHVEDGTTGRPLAGAFVAVPSAGRSVETDVAGRYRVLSLPRGDHVIAVRYVGYAPRMLDVFLSPGGALELDIALYPEPFVLDPIDVLAAGVEPADAPSSPRADRAASGETFRDHVLSAEPDPFHALGGGDVVLLPESPDGLHVRGGASDHVAYSIDGIPILSPYHSTGLFSAWNPDAIGAIALYSSSQAPSRAGALSGVVEATTREPGQRLAGRLALSTTHGSVTIDGPIGATGASLLVSARNGFHDVFSTGEASFVQGDTRDWLGKLELPAFGGTLGALAYTSEDDLSSAAGQISGTDVGNARGRNLFEWEGQSYGATWRGTARGAALELIAWDVSSDAGAVWRDSSAVELVSTRNDEGVSAAASWGSGNETQIGLRLERIDTHFALAAESDSIADHRSRARAPIATAFARRSHAFGPAWSLTGGAALSRSHDWHFAPSLEIEWKAAPRIVLRASASRVVQFAQSLRNAESVVGNLFPADLFAAAGEGGIDPAESDRAAITADVSLTERTSLSFLAFDQRSTGLALVAPEEGGPFAVGDAARGSGSSRGVSLAASHAASPTIDLSGSYTLQRVRYSDGERSYTPIFGATHLLDGGVVWKPRGQTSLRLGVSASFGRRTTSLLNGFEWEACNLLDQGCEFGGNPIYDEAALGATKLPAYLRVDLGFRQGWHIGGTGTEVGFYGTITNLLGRHNVLTYARDTDTESLVPVEMRPRAPLVVGLDARF